MAPDRRRGLPRRGRRRRGPLRTVANHRLGVDVGRVDERTPSPSPPRSPRKLAECSTRRTYPSPSSPNPGKLPSHTANVGATTISGGGNPPTTDALTLGLAANEDAGGTPTMTFTGSIGSGLALTSGGSSGGSAATNVAALLATGSAAGGVRPDHRHAHRRDVRPDYRRRRPRGTVPRLPLCPLFGRRVRFRELDDPENHSPPERVRRRGSLAHARRRERRRLCPRRPVRMGPDRVDRRRRDPLLVTV